MDQRALWNAKYEGIDPLPVNPFAKKAWRRIQRTKATTLLDVGCGGGQDALYFARKGLHVTAVDFSKSGMEMLQKQAIDASLPITATRRDIRSLRLKKSSYDVIYAHLSLHYFDDATTRKIINKLHRALKKDGLLFVKCKSTTDQFYGRGTHIGPDTYLSHGHVRHFFSEEYMKRVLAPFREIEVKQSSSFYREHRSRFVEACARK